MKTVLKRVQRAWNEFKWARCMGEYKNRPVAHCDRRLSFFSAIWYAIRSELL